MLLICHSSWERDKDQAYNMLRPFIRNAIKVAERFQIHFNELLKSQEQLGWILSFEEVDESPLAKVESPRAGSLREESPETEKPKSPSPSAKRTEADNSGSESPEPESPKVKIPSA